ncbi:MAG: acyltransferase [Cetobacterium sp.]
MFPQLKYLFFRSIVKCSKKSKVNIKGRLKATKIKVEGKNNIVEIENDSFLKNSKISIKGNNNRVLIKKGCDLKNLKIFMEDSDSLVIIGEESTCSGAKILSQEGKKVILGKKCMLSYDIEIRNSDSHKIFSKRTNERINHAKDIIIEDNVWLGMRSVILKGSHIGEGSIVAAGSIVAGDVENNSIVVGIPSRRIKDEIYWER